MWEQFGAKKSAEKVTSEALLTIRKRERERGIKVEWKLWGCPSMKQMASWDEERVEQKHAPGSSTLEAGGAKKPGGSWILESGSKIQRKPSLPSLSSLPSLISPPSLPVLTSYRPLEEQQEDEETQLRWIVMFFLPLIIMADRFLLLQLFNDWNYLSDKFAPKSWTSFYIIWNGFAWLIAFSFHGNSCSST